MTITEAVVEQIRRTPGCCARRERLRGRGARRFALPIEELIENDEDDAVEFKSTARWDVRERRTQQRDGGRDRQDCRGVPQHRRRHAAHRRRPGPLARRARLDYPHVKPPNGDGFVNWLTTHLRTPSAPQP